jgi:hypothetical protein
MDRTEPPDERIFYKRLDSVCERRSGRAHGWRVDIRVGMAAPHDNARASDLDWRLAAKCILGFMALHLVYRAITYALGGRVGSMLDPTLWYSTGLALVLSFGLCGILGTIARRGLAIGLASAVVLALPTSVAFAGGDLGFYYNFSPELNERTITTRTLPDGTVLTQSSSGEISYRRSGEARPSFSSSLP